MNLGPLYTTLFLSFLSSSFLLNSTSSLGVDHYNSDQNHHPNQSSSERNPLTSENKALKEQLQKAKEAAAACWNRLAAERVNLYTCGNQLQACMSNTSGSPVLEDNTMIPTVQR